MHETITKSRFIDEFTKIRPNNFSYDGLCVLFEALEIYEEDTGEAIEFDVISLCCDFTEYEDIEEYRQESGTDYTLEDLRGDTWVIEVDDDRFIIQNF